MLTIEFVLEEISVYKPSVSMLQKKGCGITNTEHAAHVPNVFLSLRLFDLALAPALPTTLSKHDKVVGCQPDAVLCLHDMSSVSCYFLLI